MKAPDASPVRQKVSPEPETSLPRIVLLGAVTAYREFISPTSGDRCEFYPSCSAFGRKAVSDYGLFPGVVLTADRLMRCNPLKRSGSGYLPLYDGRLYDPVENNLLTD
jgi:putative membrane protein insertion efficiency factor